MKDSGKNKKRVITYKDIIFPSLEELDFYYWCEEALSVSLISAFVYQPESFILSRSCSVEKEKQLKTKTKKVKVNLMREHKYTPDFKITRNFNGTFCAILSDINDTGFYYIDTKGEYARNNGHRIFTLNQKWVWQKHGIYINKVVPKEFFQKTWVPERSRYTHSKGLKRAGFYDLKTLAEVKYEKLSSKMLL